MLGTITKHTILAHPILIYRLTGLVGLVRALLGRNEFLSYVRVYR